MIFPQPLLIAICLIIPAIFVYRRENSPFLMIWAAMIITLDIFNSQAYFNLSAILLMGLVSLPYLYRHVREFSSDPIFKVLSTYLILLALLGVYHGFLFPWPDWTGQRTFKDRAQMRAILHWGRTILEFSALLMMTLNIRKNGERAIRLFLQTMFGCGVVLCLFAVLEHLLKIDFYYFFTGGRPLLLDFRPRSLAYEPRGLSQNLIYCVLILPFLSWDRWNFTRSPIFRLGCALLFLYFALIYTVSFAGISTLFLGVTLFLAISVLFHRKQLQAFFLPSLGLSGLLLGISPWIWSHLPELQKNHLADRFQIFFDGGFLSKFEVFDAASLNFLIHQPRYFLLGTGPGLVYLPASAYVIQRDLFIWGQRFDALPHTGLVLTVANAGVVGVFVVFAFVVLLIQRALGDQRRDQNPGVSPAFYLGVTFTLLYFIQLRYFYIFGMACLWSGSLACKTSTMNESVSANRSTSPNTYSP